MRSGLLKWTLRGVALLLVLYTALFSAVALAMLQPPERFGRIMRHMPGMVVWGLLPASRMWMWARSGDLREGDAAPDFTLPLHEGTGKISLSSHRGDRPVVLVFGSYT